MGKWFQELLNTHTIKLLLKKFFLRNRIVAHHISEEQKTLWKRLHLKSLQLKNTATEDQGAGISEAAVLVHWKKCGNPSQVHIPYKEIVQKNASIE